MLSMRSGYPNAPWLIPAYYRLTTGGMIRRANPQDFVVNSSPIRKISAKNANFLLLLLSMPPRIVFADSAKKTLVETGAPDRTQVERILAASPAHSRLQHISAGSRGFHRTPRGIQLQSILSSED
jgi:hypothetical protein